MQLLERTTFLETLAHYGTDARQGNGRLVLISGESGMGKTVRASRSTADPVSHPASVRTKI
jgi:KaiC/GvpD/RAD55 family RecA-like ATPase